ncbi:2-oxoglutarate (2OG) and Fe(II)-dependent oxygenase superfamily protein, partial [Tanacetum coccineum]
LLPSWRLVMENYYTSLLSTGKKLSSLISLALNLDDHFFHSVSALDKPYTFLRLLHYPGEIRIVYGASTHSDYGMITLLATDVVPGFPANNMFAGNNISTHGLGRMSIMSKGQRYIDLCQRGKSAILESSPARFPPICSGDYLKNHINAALSS